MGFLEQLEAYAGAGQVKKAEPMRLHTTFQTGGPADYFVTVQGWRELFAVAAFCRQEKVPMTLVGRGSNLLVKDGGIRGVVLCLGKEFSSVRREGEDLILGAGTPLSLAASQAAKNDLAGLAFAAGIPGSFGGAVVMNAGAYGGEIKDVLQSVTVLTQQGQVKELPAEALELSYRHSILPETGDWVLEGRVHLTPGKRETIEQEMAAYAKARREKQPLEYPSAGSTFRRPEGYFAGQLIEQCGLKGYRVGQACVSEKHAGFVVNLGGATASEILAVITHCQEVVLAHTGVRLECEVKILGEDGIGGAP